MKRTYNVFLGVALVAIIVLGFVALRQPGVTPKTQTVSAWSTSDWSAVPEPPSEVASDGLVGTNVSLALSDLPPADLKMETAAKPQPDQHNYKVVNFFGAWCAPCRVENPILLKLAASGVEIIGVDYEDDPEAATKFLSESGNPFSEIFADVEGKTDFTLGISSIPQTLIIDQSGTVVWHRKGRLEDEDFGRIFHAVTGGPPPGMMSASMPSVPAASQKAQNETMSMENVTARLAARLEREPNDIDGWILLARAYHELGQEGPSMSALAKARALAPGRTDIPTSYLSAASGQ